jgi:plastocyanin
VGKYLGVALAGLAAVSACSSGGSGTRLPAVDGPVAPKLDLTATEFRFSPASTAVPRGNVGVVLHNGGSVIHDLRIEGKPTLFLEAAPGQTSAKEWNLGKGRYRFYCSVSGHRQAGMEGIVEVR